ncbi:sulfurtransferase complex subunit TusB [Microbulbifer pacificus]|uniref:sulfurtransferase complex subunit TusB n=1 Tax=Microbulbifer pacificus TaxID=407164 RepID=UPI000CF57282|nr:sulfurtransferase complex subunit TusB [Microbulbifer pacificus]
MTLHIVNQSPFAGSALRDCLNAFHPGDALLLIEDGVYAAADRQTALPTGATYCLTADARARGVSIPATVESIDEARWVTLCTEHNPVVSWFR